jgi:hypothetical protein
MTASTRRAALGALASVPALALPGVAVGRLTTASRRDHPDAEIFALIERCREVNEMTNAAVDVHEKLLWANVGPSSPPKWTDADASLWPFAKPGGFPHPNDIGRLRACLAQPALWDLPGFPPQAFAERARAIVAEQDEFRSRLAAAHENPDVSASEAESNARNSEWFDLAERLAKTPATTVEGVIAKLAMVATDMAYREEDLEGAQLRRHRHKRGSRRCAVAAVLFWAGGSVRRERQVRWASNATNRVFSRESSSLSWPDVVIWITDANRRHKHQLNHWTRLKGLATYIYSAYHASSRTASSKYGRE